MAQTIVAEIGTGRRVVRFVALRAIGRIGHARDDVAGISDITGISVVVIIIIGVVVVVAGIIIAAVAVTQRAAGRQACGKAEARTETPSVIMISEAASISALCELRPALADEITCASVDGVACA